MNFQRLETSIGLLQRDSFNFSNEYDLSPSQLGLPEYNPLLISQIEITKPAIDITSNFNLPPRYVPLIQLSLNGGLKPEEGWGNALDHQKLAYNYVYLRGKIADFPHEQLEIAKASALIHDCDVRIKKQQIPYKEIVDEGNNVTLVVDQRALFALEYDDSGPSDVPGLESIRPEILETAGVTHAKWVDINHWSTAKKLVRAADSSVCANRGVNGGYCEESLCLPSARIASLKRNKPEFDTAGINEYGMSTFDKLNEVNNYCFRDLDVATYLKNQNMVDYYFMSHPGSTSIQEMIIDIHEGRFILPP